MKTNWKKYLEITMAVFMTFAACTLFFFAVLKFKSILAAFGTVASILQSIIIGLAIAYLLNPVMVFCEKKLLAFFDSDGTMGNRGRAFMKTIAIIFALLFGIAIVITVSGLCFRSFYQVFTALFRICRFISVRLLTGLWNW